MGVTKPPSRSLYLRTTPLSCFSGFDELSTAFHERGEALSSSIEQCSQLTDRLNLFLSNLSNALDQLRAQDPASCRPPILRRQIADNGAIVDLLLQKEQTFRTLKEQAQEALAQKEQQQQGTTVVEMGQRLEELDQRWMEVSGGRDKGCRIVGQTRIGSNHLGHVRNIRPQNSVTQRGRVPAHPARFPFAHR